MSVILVKKDTDKEDSYDDIKNKYEKDKRTYVYKIRAIILYVGILTAIFGGYVINNMYSSEENPAKIMLLIVYGICLLSSIIWVEAIGFSKRYGSILVSNKWELSKVKNGILNDGDFEVEIEYVLTIAKERVTITKEQYKKLSNLSDLTLMIVDIKSGNI